MENNKFERESENTRLEQTISIAQAQLSCLRESSQEKRSSIIYAKKEMREDTSHSISNLWNAQNFHDLVELSQYANPLSDSISAYEAEVSKMLILEKMIDSPYFARIDFKFDDEDTLENIYIGMSSLMDDRSYEMYVYDWRSPIASVFYRFGTGRVFYEAPNGRVTGEVNLKRQYEIRKGKLEYYFDAELQIVDEFLRKLLAQNASSKMKTIVETIQRDQDIIIRDMDTDLLVVQGVAGSGKTSVALHRAAYLMYRELSSKLSSNNIVIISPSTLFEQYISNVLPELGEKNVNSLIFDDILHTILQNEGIQTRNQFLECLLSANNSKHGSVMKNSLKFKGSSHFTEILRRFIRDLPNKWIQFSDVYYGGKHIYNRQLLKSELWTYKKATTLGLRLKQLEQSILEAIHEQRKERMNDLKEFVGKQPAHMHEVEETVRMLSIYESTLLIKQIRKFTELDCLELYKKLFSNKSYFYSLAKGLELPDCIEDIIDFTCNDLDRGHLKYDDALALVFLQLNVRDHTHDEYEDIRQVIIDEAQDYYPIHFEILNLLFPKSRYTVLGDINQTIEKNEDMSLYEQFIRILNRKNSTLLTMDKSFRCTSEILEYSKRFLDRDFKINSFSRNGDEPVVHRAPDLTGLDDIMLAEITACKEKGYQSIGLVCRTEEDALALFGRLKDRLDIRLIKSSCKADLTGTFIIPVYLSKGLEFDAVLICDADKDHYSTKDDKNLLYISCTRALHRLSLFYTGEISPLLQPQ